MASFSYALQIKKNKGIKLSYIPIAKEFSRWLSPEREVEVSLDIILGTAFIAQSPYRMKPIKLTKLKIQLE